MATSPIYNWPEPDNTDLVKNGALAIRTLGNAIDTTMATMVPKSLVDAKGDLVAATANDTPARLAVGANGTLIMADSTSPAGLKYSVKGEDLLSTTSLSGASVTISSIPQTYKDLKIVITGVTNATANGKIEIKLNGYAGTAYVAGTENAVAKTMQGGAYTTANNITRTDSNNVFTLIVDRYTESDLWKSARYFGVYNDGSAPWVSMNYAGAAYATYAITSIVISNTGGNLSTGTCYIYGVN